MPEGHTTPERINTLIDHGLLKQDVVPLALTLRDLYYDIEEKPDSKVAPTVAVAFVTAALSLSNAIEKATSSSSVVTCEMWGSVSCSCGQGNRRRRRPRSACATSRRGWTPRCTANHPRASTAAGWTGSRRPAWSR